jgi:Sec-independent protein translocase protein TatA
MRKLDVVEDDTLKDLLWNILDEIEQHREASVTKTEFNELKEIVRELGQTTRELVKAQARTEKQMEKLAKAQEELTQAQKQTEKEVAKLSQSLGNTRTQVGGLSRSMAYALENEAYRKIPKYLKTHYQLDIQERVIRTLIGGEEINLFAKANRHGEEVLIVGETVVRLDDRAKLGQLEKNVEVVKNQFNKPVFPLIITHFAHPRILDKARDNGIVVVQSFEWG